MRVLSSVNVDNTSALINVGYCSMFELCAVHIEALSKRRLGMIVPRIVVSDGNKVNNCLRMHNHCRGIEHLLRCLLGASEQVPIYVCNKSAMFVPFKSMITLGAVQARVDAVDSAFMKGNYKPLWDPLDMASVDSAQYQDPDDKLTELANMAELFRGVPKVKLSGMLVHFFTLLNQILQLYRAPEAFYPTTESEQYKKLEMLSGIVGKLRMNSNATSLHDLQSLLQTTLVLLRAQEHSRFKVTLQPLSDEAPEESQFKFMSNVNKRQSDYEKQETIFRLVTEWMMGRFKLDKPRLSKSKTSIKFLKQANSLNADLRYRTIRKNTQLQLLGSSLNLCRNSRQNAYFWVCSRNLGTIKTSS